MAVKRTYKLTRKDVNSPWPALEEWDMEGEKTYELESKNYLAVNNHISDDLMTYYHERIFISQEVMDDYLNYIKNHPDYSKVRNAEEKHYQDHNIVEEILFDYNVDYKFNS